MAASRPLRLAPEWDDRFARMLGVSALGHALVLAAVVLLAANGPPRPVPLVAYTVELTDAKSLGGRLPPGAPGPDLTGGATQPAPAAAPPPPPTEAKPEPKPEAKPPSPPAAQEPTVRIPDKPPPEVKPEPKPEPPKPPAPKPEPPKPEIPKPEPAKPEPPKPAPPRAEPPKAAPPAAAKPEPKPPAAETKSGGTAGGDAPHDAYAAAAERWRSRAGGGLGGSDGGSGPIGAGGEGKGGGGELVGLEFISYRQQVINTVKAHWTNVIGRPGLVAAVRFEIAPDGQVSSIRLARSSGNQPYDASVLRAVQQASQLPPPPARYVNEFHEFVIEFHSEESGGQGTG
jgi:TonB family protein